MSIKQNVKRLSNFQPTVVSDRKIVQARGPVKKILRSEDPAVSVDRHDMSVWIASEVSAFTGVGQVF
jgi:hypothetical protein